MAKYCTQCGRKLEEGEVCNCTAQNNNTAQDTDGQQQRAQEQQQRTQAQQQRAQEQQQWAQEQQQWAQEQQQWAQAQQQYQQNQQQRTQAQQQERSGGYTKEAEWLNRQKNAFVSGTKSMFSEILPIIKAPVSRVKELSASGTAPVGIQLIVAKAVIFLVVTVIATLVISNRISDASYGFIEIDVPYFQIIIMTLLLTAGIDFLEAVILKALTGAFNGVTNTNTMINVIGARGIYDTFILLVVVILGAMALEVALGALALLSPLSVYVQFAAYQGCVNMAEDKKPYAYFLTKLCMGVISFLIVYLLVRSSLSSLIGTVFGQMW